MDLLRSSVLFLLYGIICCQESVSAAPTDDTKLLQPAKQDQESLPSTTIQEDPPKGNEAENSAQSEKVTVVDGRESETKPDATLATPRGGDVTPTEDPHYIAKRKKCCEDGRQHFYMNGNCANRPQKENEAVGLWCDPKFLECCSFMEAYYMGPVDGCRNKPCRSRLPSPKNLSEDSPTENEAEKSAQSEKVTIADSREPQTKPDAIAATPRGGDVTPTEDPQYIAKRRKCCEDGRQNFYTNGNCANRPQKENEAVGLWCDQKFLECCSFMEAYYMGPVDGCRNKPCRSRHPSPENLSEDSPTENEAEKSAQSEKVTVADSRESQTKPDATPATARADDVTPTEGPQYIERRKVL